MKTSLVKTGFSTLLLFSVLVSCQKDEFQSKTLKTESKLIAAGPGSQIIPDQYIVIIQDEILDKALVLQTDYDERSIIVANYVSGLLSGLGVELKDVGSVYHTVFTGFSVRVSEGQLNELLKVPVIASVEPDQIIQVFGTLDQKQGMINTKAQTVNYGVSRVGSGSGQGKRAWIIDTGIDLDHPDLIVNTTLSKSFVGSGGLLGLGLFGSSSASPDDQNGHGTHCAGIIAAKDNTIGSKGVAFGAEVVAVQVLGSSGSGSNSVVIQGVDYVASKAKAGEVANMSLGGGVSSSLDNAVVSASNRGIYFALAAGNDGANANGSSPARANGNYIVTISSMDAADKMSSFSNFGNPPVDFADPGSSIYSSYKNGGYATMSGTSMAAPHAAGIMLLRASKPANGGVISGDKDNIPDVIGVK